MSSLRQRPVLILTGGLGNQLFQIAHATYMYPAGTIDVDWRLARPRLDKSGRPEVQGMNLDKRFVFSTRPNFLRRILFPSYPLRKFSNLYLRKIVTQGNFGNWSIGNSWFLIIWKIAGFLYFHKSVALNPKSNSSVKFPCLLGYFQDPIWLNDDNTIDSLSRISCTSTMVDRYKALALSEKPLAVHIRLMDYRFDENIGLIPRGKFVEVVSECFRKGDFGKIWLFSDEPLHALNSLIDFKDSIRVIETNLSSAETIAVMSLSRAFVISNSTFSWWGAYLSDALPQTIFAPLPWFKVFKTPLNLIPLGWQTYDPWR